MSTGNSKKALDEYKRWMDQDENFAEPSKFPSDLPTSLPQVASENKEEGPSKSHGSSGSRKHRNRRGGCGTATSRTDAARKLPHARPAKRSRLTEDNERSEQAGEAEVEN